MKGFFWLRRKYRHEAEIEAIRSALERKETSEGVPASKGPSVAIRC
jgi:hypothetical protein